MKKMSLEYFRMIIRPNRTILRSQILFAKINVKDKLKTYHLSSNTILAI